MSNSVIALLFAAGVSGWMYSKAVHYTGGNKQRVIPIVILVFVLTFLLAITLLRFVPGN